MVRSGWSRFVLVKLVLIGTEGEYKLVQVDPSGAAASIGFLQCGGQKYTLSLSLPRPVVETVSEYFP